MIEIQRLSTLALIRVFAGKNLDHALTDARGQAAGQLTDHERASLQDVGYGVLRHRTELERVLQGLYVKGAPQPPLDTLLMVAAYQLLHTRSAHHAIVSHAVETAALLAGAGCKGFINGVLRNLLRQRETLLTQAHSTDAGRFSHPEWWIEKLKEQYPALWEEILTQAQTRAPMTLRVNRRHSSRDQYQARLKQLGLESTPVGEVGLVLAEPLSVEALPGFDAGDVSVQDASAQWAAPLLGLHPRQRVLDACAAPGGKTSHILEQTTDLEVVALDRDAGRLKKVEASLQRLKLTAAHTQAVDAGRLEDWWDQKLFDRVLLDAPCSGSGVVRRHPDIKWLRRPEDIPQLAQEQERLLEALWHVVRRGGRLLYVTCSLFKEENQDQVQGFLQRHTDARLNPIEDTHFKEGLLTPDALHDGFFYAVLQKT
jgi:16S rRNA (cytosine967-C5)-methyltransferase